MAGTHEGYSLGIKANYAQVEEAKKATTALYSALGDVERRAKNLHMDAALPREINHIDTVTASYIRRLESEGKTYEANKQKVSAYQGAIAELSKKQNDLRSALDKAKDATDRNSDAYRTQRIRFNENVAEINRYKAGLKSANEEMRRANPSFLDRIKSKLNGVNKEAGQTHRTFKEVFAGSVLGNALSNSLSSIGSGLKNAYEEGMNLNLAVAKINGRFKGMGMSARQIQSLDKQIGDLKANTTMTGNNVADLQAHMLSWSAIGTKGAMQMASTMAAVGDTSKLTGDQIELVSANLQRVGANGKVTYSSLSRITKSAPTFMAQLARGAGMSQSKMTALLKTGKVTQKQFQGWMAAASKYSGTAFKGFGKTQAGALKQMQVAWQKLEQQFTKPIFNAKTSGLQALKDIMTSKTVMNGADQLGNAISSTIGFLDKHKSDIVGITKNVVAVGVAVGKATWKDFAAIIQNVGKSLGIVHGNGKEAGDTLHTLKVATGKLAKNKTAVQWVAKAIIAMAAVKGLKAVTSPLIDLGTKGAHTFQAVRGISRGLRGITDAKKIENMGKLEKSFFNVGKGARSAVKGVSKAVGWLGKKAFSGSKSLLSKAATLGRKIGSAVTKGITSAAKGIGKLGSKLFSAGRSLVSKAATLGKKIGNAITKGIKATTKFSMGKRLAVGALAGAAVATPEAINAVKDRHSANKRSQDIGGAVGALAGGTLTSMIPVVGPMLAPVGAIIGKYAGRWGGQAVNNFTKGWQSKKPPKNFWSLENLGWSAHSMWNGFTKSVGNTITWFKKNWKEVGLYFVSPLAGAINSLYKHNPKFRKWVNGLAKGFQNAWKGTVKWFSNLGKGIQKSWKDMTKWSSKLGKNMAKGLKSAWAGMTKWFSNLGKGIQKSWKGMTKWFSNLGHDANKWFKSKWSGMKSWAGGIYKNVQAGWQGFQKWLGGLAKGAVDLFKKPFEGLSKWVSDHIPEPVKAVFGGIGSGINWVKSKITGKAHANGGIMRSTHAALVGEAGPELAYKPYANHVRLLGANGPEFTKVQSGEHILNSHDTRKVLGGGLGHGMVLKGYANGTEKLGKTKKTVTDDYKQIVDNSSKSLDKLSRLSKNIWSKITHQTGSDTRKLSKTSKNTWSKILSQTGKDTSKLSKTNSRTWSKIASLTGRETNKTKKMAISHYSDMRNGIHKQMDKIHDGVVDLARTTSKGFGKELGRMKGYAHDAMSDTISQVNKGISGIDKVLGQFGGNTSVIKPVKFATGTDANGRLTRDTYAMVNDATSGPRQEALISDKNEVFMPRGHNVKMMIPKGWGVLNGVQTLQAGLQHFAKGSGLSHSALRKLAEKAGANPVQSFKDMFLSHLIPSKTDFGRGSTNLASNSGKHFGNPWSNAMWTVINNAIGGANGKGGTREAFLNYAESTFSGVKYHLGAASKTLSDCSGMVMQALRHFGINIGRTTVAMQESSGAQYLGKSLSKTLPGDLVIFGHGTGSAGHVGIIKNPKTGTMFNETQPRAHVSSIADDEGMGYGFYRVRGLHNAKKSSKLSVSKSLEALAKRELGSRALKWIGDNLADQDSLVAGTATGDHAHWLKQAHIPEKDWSGINYIVSHESGWNPRAVNPSSGTYGLGQMQGYNLHYYTAHGAKSNPIAQLMGMMDYIHDRYGTVAKAVAFWQSNHAYAKGGKPAAHTPFIAGENGPELITADGPVKVDTHEQTKHKLSDLVNLVEPKINRPTHKKSSAPIININFNGPIGGSIKDAKKIAEIVKQEITQYLVNIGDEFGTDPSLY